MPKMVRLKAPDGTDTVNYGTKAYRVDNDGTVGVPIEAVDDLLTTGGFTRVDPTTDPVKVPPVPPQNDPVDALPDGYGVVRHADEGVVHCSWGGQGFERRHDSTFAVPNAAVSDLLSHGFSAVEKE